MRIEELKTMFAKSNQLKNDEIERLRELLKGCQPYLYADQCDAALCEQVEKELSDE